MQFTLGRVFSGIKKKVMYVVQVLRILIQRFKGSHNYLKVGG